MFAAKSKPTAKMNEEKISWLRLARSENVGPITFFKLIECFKTATRALERLPDMAQRGGKKSIQIYSRDNALREIETHQKKGIHIITSYEDTYPDPLRQIADPPPILSARGDLSLLQKRSIGVVGARNASGNGRRFAAMISEDLGSHNFIITSGLARGIDTAAHTGALKTGTIAVLGGGVDVVYPQENQNLYDQICKEGLVISETSIGTQPMARHFPRRNRIISGLSLGVIVVEAALKSGSLITARQAAEQGREVFAVPGSPVDPRCRGTNLLIKEGAALIENAQDVIDGLKSFDTPKIVAEEPQGFANENEIEFDEQAIESHRDKIINLLSTSPINVDELIRQCELSAMVVSTVMLELELAGRVERYPGNQFALVA